MGSTSNNREVSQLRKRMLTKVTLLRAEINDENALMSHGRIGELLTELAELRNEYADAAWKAHTEYCTSNNLS